MQDAKTGGSRWVPDIREDEITEFHEQNGDETATYKAVNVHPIISRILDKLAFFRTHVSAVWYNKLANKTVKDKLDEIDTSISSLNSRTTFAEYSNVDLNMVNEYCFVVIDSNSESYNAPSIGRYLCTPQAIGFQIGIDMNAGNFYARGHNWGSFSDWRSFSFS